MKTLLLSFALLSLSLEALAGETVNKTIDVDQHSYVSIEHVNGVVEIHGWDKAQVKVMGTLGDKTDKFIFERDGDDVTIKVKNKKSSFWGKLKQDDGDDLQIFVPVASKVRYSAVNANVELDKIEGGIDAETVNGAIQARNLAGRISLESVNGEINTSGLAGDTRIETVNGSISSSNTQGKEGEYSSVNGNINIQTSARELKAETVNGSIKLALGAVNKLELESVNGEIQAQLALIKGGEVDASTVGGTVELYFQKEISARFDIQAHAGGNIVNDLSDDKVKKDKYGPSRWLEFSVNGGNGKVNVSTVSGNVKIDNK